MTRSTRLVVVAVGVLAVVTVMADSAAAATPGGVLWTQRYDGAAHGADIAYATAVIPDGKIAVATGLTTKNGNDDMATVGYDPATGQKKWAATFNGPTNGVDIGR